MPIPPTNLSPATAYDLTGLLPLQDTINLTSLPNPQKVWFKFTLSGEFAISSWIQAETTGFHYRSKINYYFGLPANPATGILQSGTEDIVEFFIEESIGVAKVGTIYISIENNYIVPSNPTPTIPLAIRFQSIPNVLAPKGSIFISNDITGHPATIISPSGTPVQIRSFTPHGESGAILSNGISLWGLGQVDNTKLILCNADFEVISEITWADRTNLRDAISSDHIDTFYLESGGKIISISSTGVINRTTPWIIPTGLHTYYIAPSAINNDIIYVKNSSGIAKFYKSTQVLDAYFIPYELMDVTGNFTYYYMSGYYGDEIIVNSDDSIVTFYTATSSNPDKRAKIVYYSPTGTVIRTMMCDDEDINRIGPSNVTVTLSTRTVVVTTFKSWAYTESFSSRIIEWDLTTGLKITEFILPTTSYSSSFSEITEFPDELFGVPESCPLVIIPNPLPKYGLRTISSLTITKVTDPDSAAKVWSFTTTGGLVPPTFNLLTGEDKIYVNPAPGIYSVIEIEDPSWETDYDVSNGNPNTHINLTAGSNITVTVINTKKTPVGTGIYFINPTKATRHDSYYTNEERKIPNPTVKTALLGE